MNVTLVNRVMTSSDGTLRSTQLPVSHTKEVLSE